MDKTNYERTPFPFKEHRIKIKSRPGINSILKNSDQKSPLAIKPTNIFNNLKNIKNSEKRPRIKDALPDHNPSLTKDKEGNIYLVWEHGNELWWAVNKNNDWSTFGKLTDEGGAYPRIVYEPELLDYGTSEGLFCIWESISSPHKIMVSIGRPTNEEIIWTKPQPITTDTHNDYGTALITDKNNQPLVLWLQSDDPQDDDSDLYYQIININTPKPEWAEVFSVWNYNQNDDPAVMLPFISSTCIERNLAGGASLIPRIIPIFGGTFGFQLVTSICTDFSEIPEIAPQMEDYDPNRPLYPFLLSDLALCLKLGRRIYIDNIVFAAAAAVVEKDANNQDIVTQKAAVSGGDIFINFYSFPIPLFIGFLPIGRVRIGAILQVGADVRAVQYIDQNIDQEQENKTNILSQTESNNSFQDPEMSDQNFPDSLWDIDFSQIDETTFLVEMSMGATSFFRAFGGIILGEVFALGGFATTLTFPANPSDSDYVYKYRRFPFFTIAGYIRCGGPWNGIIEVYERTITSFNPDPNSLLKPQTFRSSAKDRLLKRDFNIIENSVSRYEAFESVKKIFQGTGSQYEGKTVLNDITNDIYNDGLPDLAKSNSGEILVAWAKGFATSILGSKIYVAEYKEDKWDNPVEITKNINFNEGTAIVFDSYDNPMLVWSSASNKGLNYEESSVEEILKAMENADLMYAQRIKGKWTTPERLSLIPGKDSQVKLASGPQGEITAVWVNQVERDSIIYTSIWNGKIWSKPKPLTKVVLAESPSIIYSNDKPLIIWAQDNDGNLHTYKDWNLYYSLWNGSFWSPAHPVSFKKKGPKWISNR